MKETGDRRQETGDKEDKEAEGLQVQREHYLSTHHAPRTTLFPDYATRGLMHAALMRGKNEHPLAWESHSRTARFPMRQVHLPPPISRLPTPDSPIPSLHSPDL